MDDDATAHVRRFLAALRYAYERLLEASNEVRRWSDITIARPAGAQLAGSPFRLGAETFDGAITFGMGAQWSDGTSVDWMIWLFWSDATWTVRSDVGLEDDDGRTVLDDLGSRRSTTLDECIEHIDQVVDSIVAGLPKIRTLREQ